MKKKTVHTSPMEYRIRYVINGSSSESTQYYSVYHSSEAIDFLAHTFRQGHIHANYLRIVLVEEFDRFGDKWIDRTAKAIEHAEAAELQPQGKDLWLRKAS